MGSPCTVGRLSWRGEHGGYTKRGIERGQEHERGALPVAEMSVHYSEVLGCNRQVRTQPTDIGLCLCRFNKGALTDSGFNDTEPGADKWASRPGLMEPSFLRGALDAM